MTNDDEPLEPGPDEAAPSTVRMEARMAFLGRLIDAVQEAVIATSLDGTIVYWNRFAEVLLGWTSPEAVGMNLLDVTPPPSARTRALEIMRTLKTGASWSGEFTARHKDGSQFPVLVTDAPIYDEGGVLTGFVSTLRDVTERKQAEQTYQRLAAIIESSDDAIISMTLEGDVLSWNAGAEKTFGYAAEEVIGRNVSMLVPEERVDELEFTLRRLKRGESVSHLETQRRHKDGRLVEVLLSVSPLRTASGQIVGASSIVHDVTEQKQAEIALRRSEEQLLQAQRLEAIGRLAGGVAHDFNNLLTVINGYGDILLRQLAESDPKREAVLEIRRSGDRAAALTRQLLAFSRRQVLEPKTLNLNVTVAEMGKMLTRLIGEDVDLVLIPDPALGAVRADPGQIEQVIMNLAVNARDAMPDGGTLTIETANVELDDSYSSVDPDIAPGPFVGLSVSDTGFGMDETTLEHIFEPFFTTKGPGKGTGLGLATVYGIVKQSGGSIEVTSRPGKGTTFKIYLPRVEGRKSVDLRAVDDHLGGTETVLVAEDEPGVRRLVVEGLRRVGYKVLEAANGEEALVISSSHDGPIDALVTDVIMPRMGGKLLAEQLAADRPNLKVLYISGYTDDAVLQFGSAEPGAEFLGKPFTPADLTRKVRELLDRPVRG